MDDGAGRLYGSGVEPFLFVVFCQGLGYGAAILMHEAFDATDVNSHLTGTVLGGIALVVPTMSRVLSGASNAGCNFRRGLLIAFVLQMLWLALMLFMTVSLSVERSPAMRLSAGYSLSFVVVLFVAIWR